MPVKARFALVSREPLLDTDIAEFDTFVEAEKYQAALGRTGKHVNLMVIDRSKNVIADASDEEEKVKLEKSLALEATRTALMDIQEANLIRARKLREEEAALKVG